MDTQNGSQQNTTSSEQQANNANSQPQDQNKQTIALLAYIIFFIPMLTNLKDDPFVKFHTKQGIVLFILTLIGFVLSIIPLIQLISLIIMPVSLVLMVIGILNVLKGKQAPLPIIGSYADNLNF